MNRIVSSIVLLLLFWGCKDAKEAKVSLKEGLWRGTMQVSSANTLPFNFMVEKQDEGYNIEIYNADEVVSIDEIDTDGDSITIKMPVFEGYIAGTFTNTQIKGDFIKESLDRIVPFSATFGDAPRFETVKAPVANISGVWQTQFDYDTDTPYDAKGIFVQNGKEVTGTFRTTTGDYRYLEGVVDGDSLKLSTFDGAHVFLFAAKVTDSTFDGTFYSGNHAVEKFTAKRNPNFELPDANTLTYLKDGYDKLEFSFPDTSGNMVSLDDEAFQDKVVLVQIMGSWCPNCLDETKFYVDYRKNNPDKDLAFVALAFEYAKTEEKAFNAIKRLKEHIGVPYPIALAQFGSSNKQLANEKLPMLNHVLSYPTTIYVDKKGKVRKIHTGFNGPATGSKYEQFKKEFGTTVQSLLAEN